MGKNIRNRNEIDNKYKWNIEAMYTEDSEWEKDLERSLADAEKFTEFRGHLAESSGSLLKALRAHDSIWMCAEKMYVYASMKKDEDNRAEKYQGMFDRAQNALSEISTSLAFFTPELLECDRDRLLAMTEENNELKEYRFMLEDLLREKDHILSHNEEALMAQFSQITPATKNIFTMLNNADMSFGTITDEDGNEVQLTHGNFITFMESRNRQIRQDAFEKVYTAYSRLINTLATTYSFTVRKNVMLANIRKYPSARAASLASGNIDEKVYDNLINAVHDYLPVMHRYMEIRKKMLGTDELRMSDLYVPLVEVPETHYTFDEAVSLMTEALAPMGEQYIEDVKNGISQGWVDVYENTGKTSGAYSFGSYDSYPYILMNFSETLKDVFTLVHEMGHSMHSFYTRKNQPFIYGDYSIFTAEVASTVNENLLMKHLIAEETDIEMKKYLINYHLEEFRTTLFRQVMFAEFELWTHRTVEEGGTLTAQSMCDFYNELNRKYYGEAVSEDPWIRYEWARIPHFYNAFYVYQYATGYSAAAAISDIILKNGPEDYLSFLKTGSSNHPIELLKIAGVDMGSEEPVIQAMKVFEKLVDQFEELVL